MKKFNLTPNDSHKSFYGKAVCLEIDGGALLSSYGTIVCGVESDGTFHKFWDGYSATTMRHVNAFLANYGIAGGGKKWWESLECEIFDDYHYMDVA